MKRKASEADALVRPRNHVIKKRVIVEESVKSAFRPDLFDDEIAEVQKRAYANSEP